MKGIYSVLLLITSNAFMTMAWYGHLKFRDMKWFSALPLFVVILISWGIALFEYFFQVPANRIGYKEYGGPFSLLELKVIQEVITMIVFAGFAILYMKQPLKIDFLWAGFCLVGAVYFMFREGLPQS